MDSPCKHDANKEPEEAGEKAKLSGEDRPDQRTRPRNCRKMVAEENPLVRRLIILTVIESVGRCLPAVVERNNFGGDERTIETVGYRHHTQSNEDKGESIHSGFPCDVEWHTCRNTRLLVSGEMQRGSESILNMPQNRRFAVESDRNDVETAFLLLDSVLE